ncbi:MAG: hypothetical protein GY711_21135 [bacterium]|nr:hypothetical protein [bacterium]
MRELLALRDSEGLTLRELSELCGVAQGTLSWWASEVRRRDASRSPEFVEVVLEAGAVEADGVSAEEPIAADEPHAAAPHFTVTLRTGQRVAVPQTYGLTRLVRELEGC